MVSLAPAGASPAPPRHRLHALVARLNPAEGWTAILLHVVLLLAAAWTVQQAEWAPDRTLVAIATLGGLGAGLGLAKLRAADLLAHAIAFWWGLAVAIWMASEQLPAAVGDRRARLWLLWEKGLEWYRLTLAGHRVDDPDLFVVLVGLTIWLVAYTSAWTLYRRGWLTAAIVLPGLIAVVNLGYAPAAGTAPLLIFIVAACLLAALHHAYRREREWARSHLPRPPRLPWRFFAAGVNLALLAAILGWTLPLSARADISAAAWDRLDGPWLAAAERWGDRLADWVGVDQAGGGSYATFGESFRLGGALNLSDEPVMILRNAARRSTYLAGHRYDEYTGAGWSSDVDATFEERNADGDRYDSRMRFPARQGVHLSPAVTVSRAEVTGRLTVLQPKGRLLFSTDTFLTADRRTNVQLSWRQLRDERFDLGAETLRDIPVDLRSFAALLRQATFSVPGADDAAPGAPAALEPDRRRQIEEAQLNLRRRFLETAWTVGPDGRAQTLIVTGQVPVYDDVEAVFAEEAVATDQSYEITALASTASAAELRTAGTDYPSWVRDRYLDLPDTVTDRTRSLAADLAAGADNPFDVAQAMQDHVRARITYNEAIDRPPRDQDVVDYVLFDSQEGYCEYYASAMAVMLRMEGIPARVAGGYFAVPYDPTVDGFLYREESAHLWVEAFFPGYGWIAFEPTASRDTLDYGDLSAPVEPLPPAPVEPTPAPPVPTPVASPVPPAAAPIIPDTNAEPGRPNPTLEWATLIGGGALLLGILLFSAVWLWGFRGLTPAGGFYARALRAGRWWGVRPSPTVTPIEYADQLGRAVPAAHRPARVVADLYSEELFAGRPTAPGALRSARAAWGDLRRAMLRSLPRRRRSPDRRG